MKNPKENDLLILKQLYCGYHLSEQEKERALKLLYLLKKELNKRL